jgi:hypothetical protein
MKSAVGLLPAENGLDPARPQGEEPGQLRHTCHRWRKVAVLTFPHDRLPGDFWGSRFSAHRPFRPPSPPHRALLTRLDPRSRR